MVALQRVSPDVLNHTVQMLLVANNPVVAFLWPPRATRSHTRIDFDGRVRFDLPEDVFEWEAFGRADDRMHMIGHHNTTTQEVLRSQSVGQSPSHDLDVQFIPQDTGSMAFIQ